MVLSNILTRLTGHANGISGPSNDIVKIIKDLESSYSNRKKVFDDWYSLLSLEDMLKQDDMESFVGNDPRTTWNMATFLLQPKPMIHRVISKSGDILPDNTRPVRELVQQHFTKLWAEIDRSDMKRGRQSWFWGFVGFLVGTGWYALPFLMKPDGKVFVDYWNPATVYPEFSDDPEEGLLRLARVRTISGSQAHRIAIREEWDIGGNSYTGRVVEGQLWEMQSPGVVAHGAIFNNKIVKPLTIVPGLDRIPVVVGATGGIPVFRTSTYSNDTLGQSILATNEPLYRNFNKQQTFMQQLLRDSANPRVIERSTSNIPIVTPDRWYKRGAFFKIGINDSIEPVQAPGIPVELTQLLFGLSNMMQRGGFSNLTFGNVLQEITSVLVTQAAEAALQLITPYHNVVQFSITEVTDFWWQQYLTHPELRPDSWRELPFDELQDTRIISSYNIKIPGDFTNRINMAKTLNPRFEIPVELLMELLTPEITNIPESVAKLEGERAKLNPMFAQVQLIQAFEEGALAARQAGNIEGAQLFDSVANVLKQQIQGGPTPEERIGTTEAEGIIPDMSSARLGR